MIRDFTFHEKDRQIFCEEFARRLPERIIDGHNHTWLKANLTISKEEYAVHKNYKPWTDFDFIEEFTINNFEKCIDSLFPGKDVTGIFFGLPFRMIDIENCNRYVIENASLNQRGFYYIPGQFEDAFTAERRFSLSSRKGFLGLKPYPDLAEGKNGAPGLYDMLNISFLEYADRHSLVIMLHIPGNKRLRDERLRKDLSECVKTYRGATFIMAHVGRSFCYSDVERSIDFLTEEENVFFDTALINDPLVIEYLLRRTGSEKVIYGSDSPLAFTRGKDICVNNKHYYVAPSVVPWGISAITPSLLDLTFYVYEELRAILYATKAVYGANEQIHLQNIFFNNSAKMLRKTGISI
jgi:hypothetical protein